MNEQLMPAVEGPGQYPHDRNRSREVRLGVEKTFQIFFINESVKGRTEQENQDSKG